MRFTVVSFRDIHLHGDLFTRMLEARYKSFIEIMGYDVPSHDRMEFDQYDTPESRWVAIQNDDDDTVLAGFRLTMTTAKCANYTYMIKDASRGLLAGIPDNILDEEAPVCPTIWECSRAFVCQDVGLTGRERQKTLEFMITCFLPAVRSVGGETVITLTNNLWPIFTRRCKVKGRAMGPMMDIDGAKFQVIHVTDLPKKTVETV